MAEVRKKVLEDKYNTKSIKTKVKKVEKNEVKTPTKKSTKVTGKKVVKSTNSKVVKTSGNKNKKTTEKKGLFTKFRIFCNGVVSEFKKVHWPSKKDMIKYSMATIVFVVFCGLFFYAIDIIFAFIKTLI